MGRGRECAVDQHNTPGSSSRCGLAGQPRNSRTHCIGLGALESLIRRNRWHHWTGPSGAMVAPSTLCATPQMPVAFGSRCHAAVGWDLKLGNISASPSGAGVLELQLPVPAGSRQPPANPIANEVASYCYWACPIARHWRPAVHLSEDGRAPLRLGYANGWALSSRSDICRYCGPCWPQRLNRR